MAASTRQRFVQYEPALAEAGVEITYAPLLGDDHVLRLAQGRGASPVATAMAYARRLRTLMSARSFDALWVHYELFPYLPGALERIISLPGKPIITDYDDAIFHMYDDARNPVVRRLLRGKLAPLMRASTVVCAGNRYLADYAARFCDRVEIIPTVVDIDAYVPAAPIARQAPTIGWIGSPSTWAFVRPCLRMLAELHQATGARFLAVGAGPAGKADRFEGLDLVEWSEATEIASVQAMDIGIMPLPDEPWARGKCGYKLIQYMACGLPVVASPVGVNATIVVPGETGFLAHDMAEWRSAIERLLADPALRQSMGGAGRARAVESYSLQSQAPRLVEIMRQAVPSQAGRSV